MTNLELILYAALKTEGLTDGMEHEYRFDPDRRWRFDFAWPALKIAVEIEGGQYVNGRHQRAAGFAADCEKYNAAQLVGWRVFRFSTRQVINGTAFVFIKAIFDKKME
jgi:very-short-patch-repair endonuclease